MRSNMKSLGSHNYIVGKQHIAKLTTEQGTALGCTEGIEVFYRLYKDGILYYSTGFNTSGKRENTYCCYFDAAGKMCFGQIELFVIFLQTFALVRLMRVTNTTVLNLGGNPCRRELDMYREANLLNRHIIPVHLPSRGDTLSPVPINNIVSKVVIVSASSNHFCIKQPNQFERH